MQKKKGVTFLSNPLNFITMPENPGLPEEAPNGSEDWQHLRGTLRTFRWSNLQKQLSSIIPRKAPSHEII